MTPIIAATATVILSITAVNGGTQVKPSPFPPAKISFDYAERDAQVARTQDEILRKLDELEGRIKQ